MQRSLAIKETGIGRAAPLLLIALLVAFALAALAIASRTGSQAAKPETRAEVKKALVGVGGADKAQVHAMVQRLLPGAAPAGADAADALAVALTHAHMSATAGRTGVSTALLRRRGA